VNPNQYRSGRHFACNIISHLVIEADGFGAHL
jgi:hypothetical protein